MKAPVSRITLSSTAKYQLITLKRRTGIDAWNVLCRWALCLSLAEPTMPSPVSIPSDSNVELTWETFAGGLSDVLILALRQRCYSDGLILDDATIAQQFRLHLHRGIGYLNSNPHLKSIQALIQLVVEQPLNE